jgi:hypothetical protein
MCITAALADWLLDWLLTRLGGLAHSLCTSSDIDMAEGLMRRGCSNQSIFNHAAQVLGHCGLQALVQLFWCIRTAWVSASKSCEALI